jgi:hypothetical protein
MQFLKRESTRLPIKIGEKNGAMTEQQKRRLTETVKCAG